MASSNPAPTQPTWLAQYAGGIEGGGSWSVVLTGTRYALIKIPGRKYWTARAEQGYGRTHYDIVRMDASALNDPDRRKIAEGRLTADVFKTVMILLNALDGETGVRR